MGILLICQNNTMQVYGGWTKRYCDLCSKHIAHRTVCYNSPLVRGKPIGASAFPKIIYCPRQGCITVSFYSVNGLDLVILMKSVTVCIYTWSCFTTSGHERNGQRFADDIFKSRLSRKYSYIWKSNSCAKHQQISLYTLFPNIKQAVYLGHYGASYGRTSKCDIGFIAVHRFEKIITMA